MRLLLGSQSPRRRELLAGLDIPFECVDIHADESFPPNLQAGDIPLYIAKQKAAAGVMGIRNYLRNHPFTNLQNTNPGESVLLLTADTIVWIAGRMLGKPKNEEEAKAMLRLLSGRTHQVYTAVVITQIKDEDLEIAQTVNGECTQNSFVDCTDVTFRALTDAEIDYYMSHYHPLDKAGAYGVQEYIGYIGVEKIVGSYYNVMGLPVERLYLALRNLLPELD